MKKSSFCILFVAISFSVNCQSFYYVFFTDKNTVEFNPYTYFDQKAIERRVLHGISLYDSSDFPVNQQYINQVVELSEEYVGEIRWFNMVMISATDEHISTIRNFSFVKNIIPISENSNLQLAKYQDFNIDNFLDDDTAKNTLSKQLQSLQGGYFVKNNFNGSGIRIAVFDGGFPSVDTHPAFEHLRKNNQIVNTWNFPNKKENVYGWNSHGTMVLSCIAGIKSNGQMLGLATGAEFLLARTEVETEPKKEEFWWLKAVEWADKNGANIINSSLGYGIDRHYFEELDGKTTLVTKAANMAAAKGILVCNSAGNEGSDRKWKKIIAPADADSILTVGGINASLTNFTRSHFSSYGPTVDGRMKPNVVAFGEAQAAKPSKNIQKDAYSTVQGTSFSSPLIAGFAACAWQSNKNLTVMELKSEIEKSASLYPYFDYAFGYGVPQASYFTENQKNEIEKMFEITNKETTIWIMPYVEKIDFLEKQHYLFYNIQNEDGTLEYYAQINLYDCLIQATEDRKYTANCPAMTYKTDSAYYVGIMVNSTLINKTLNVFFNGYFESYKIEDAKPDNKFNRKYSRPNFIDVKNQKQSKWGYKAKHFMTGYVAYSMFVPVGRIHRSSYNYAKSHNFDIGIRYKYNVCKWYAIGGNFEFGIKKLHYRTDIMTHSWASSYSLLPTQEKIPTTKYDKMVNCDLSLEFFQRFRLATTSFGDVYFDLGVDGSVMVSSKRKILREEEWHGNDYKAKYTFKQPLALGWGLKARLGYGFIALFTQCETYYPNRSYGFTSLGIELSIPY